VYKRQLCLQAVGAPVKEIVPGSGRLVRIADDPDARRCRGRKAALRRVAAPGDSPRSARLRLWPQGIGAL